MVSLLSGHSFFVVVDKIARIMRTLFVCMCDYERNERREKIWCDENADVSHLRAPSMNQSNPMWLVWLWACARPRVRKISNQPNIQDESAHNNNSERKELATPYRSRHRNWLNASTAQNPSVLFVVAFHEFCTMATAQPGSRNSHSSVRVRVPNELSKRLCSTLSHTHTHTYSVKLVLSGTNSIKW